MKVRAGILCVLSLKSQFMLKNSILIFEFFNFLILTQVGNSGFGAENSRESSSGCFETIARSAKGRRQKGSLQWTTKSKTPTYLRDNGRPTNFCEGKKCQELALFCRYIFVYQQSFQKTISQALFLCVVPAGVCKEQQEGGEGGGSYAPYDICTQIEQKTPIRSQFLSPSSCPFPSHAPVVPCVVSLFLSRAIGKYNFIVCR